MNEDKLAKARLILKLVPVSGKPVAEAQKRAEQVVLKIAELIGRQMAREDFASRQIPAGENRGKSPE
jgi:hypothetical protein